MAESSVYEIMASAVKAAYESGFRDGYRTGHADGAEDCPVHRTAARRLFRDSPAESRETPEGRRMPGLLAQVDRRRAFDRGDFALCQHCWRHWNTRILAKHQCRTQPVIA